MQQVHRYVIADQQGWFHFNTNIFSNCNTYNFYIIFFYKKFLVHSAIPSVLKPRSSKFLRAYAGTTKFRPSTLLQTISFHLICLLSFHWLKEMQMVEISSYRRTLVRRCYGRNLDGLGFRVQTFSSQARPQYYALEHDEYAVFRLTLKVKGREEKLVISLSPTLGRKKMKINNI